MAAPPYLPVVAWVSCARCSGELFAEPQTLPRSSGLPGDGPWVYCKTCRPLVERERAARPCVPGARCVHVDYPRGPFADMVVTKVEGDQVMTMVLGFPDGVPEGAWLFHHTIGHKQYTRGELIMTGQ